MKRSELKIGAILTYINLAITLIVSFLLVPIMLAKLGQNEYGLYQLIGAFAGYLSILEFGLGNTIIRYVAKFNVQKDEKSKENFLALSMIIYGIISVIIVIIGTLMFFNIKNIFVNSIQGEDIFKAQTMFVILIINIIITIISSVFTSIISGYEKFIFTRLFSVVMAILKNLLIIIVLYVFPSAIYLTMVVACISIISCLVNIFYVFKKLKIKIKLHYWDNILFKEVMLFSFANFIQMLMGQIYWKLDDMIVGIMLNTAMVAVYSIATQINLIVLNITTCVTLVILPRATQMAINNASIEETTNFMSQIGRIICVLYIYITIAFAFFGKYFIQIWIGKDYIEAYYMALILIISAAIPRIQGAANDIMRAKNLHGFLTTIYLIAGIINVFLTVIFINLWGLIGAAIGTAFSLIVGNIVIANIYYQKRVGINVRMFFKATFKGILIPSIISVICCVGLIYIPLYGYKLILVQGMIYTIIFALLMWKFGLNNYEKNVIKSILNRQKEEVK